LNFARQGRRKHDVYVQWAEKVVKNLKK
jgi:hypothetical protein